MTLPHVMSPQELKAAIGSGLLSFPLTDFDPNGDFDPGRFAARLEWLEPYGASALFLAGGAGEFFSLTGEEYGRAIRTGVQACRGRVPAIAGAGGPTRFAIACTQEAESAGASGILLMPHYMTEATQDGLAAHVEAVCASTRLGIILYNRGLSVFRPQTLARLAERCPNLVGFKDGSGDIELLVAIRQTLGKRLAFLCGMPTAEIYAAAYKGLGIPVYSSAVFNFVPRTALEFHQAVQTDDVATQDRLLQDFYLPFAELRRKGAGYAVSLIKAGAKLVGHDAGPVRPPLSQPTAQECETLAGLIKKMGSQ